MAERRFTIGYALLPKKQKSFIQDSLVNLCKSRGIDLIKIHTENSLSPSPASASASASASAPQKPPLSLVDQGPFDCVLHKLYGEDWKKQLDDFKSRNPNAVIIDSPDAIERLHNRISMLQVVSELRIESESETFGIPKQIVIYDKETLFDRQAWEFLKFPVIAKPLVADGSAKSHKMALVFNHEGLNKLKPPIVLQEFVNHGGVIFKVYVVGEYVKCVKRKSLPDVSEEKLKSLEGSLSFSQVSNLGTQQHQQQQKQQQQQKNNNNNNNDYDCDCGGDDGDDDKFYKMMNHMDDTELPPQSFITDIARGLRKAMKLNLFNFDVIRDTKKGNRYLVIDINYFPGYAKMPCYETVLTDFFWDVVNNKSHHVDAKMMMNEGVRKIVSNSCCCSDGEEKKK